eukprot:CAMPEP_0206038762 /NCGR_PEP_ID=MMETSP1466-20131121/4319_1 /ASSEMBLY_ACC=CAM_ASM_001126 /TAXON_ID=44452 /ORGANISM="Pavlova gyrans, Strain CCMP608" /LENGTH=172 /DNA_ID=CAMNT_0053413369 /DNA_START=76 /DNA_END=594 /DNA_ORIENTATION=-
MPAARTSPSPLPPAPAEARATPLSGPKALVASADDAALGDVDAVKELADVLVLDVARLVDECAREGHLLHVVAKEADLVLDVGRALHRHAVVALDAPHDLLAEEVADLHHRVLLHDGHVDGEVRVHKAHLVFEALSNASDHVKHVEQQERMLAACLGLPNHFSTLTSLADTL